jgi:hypothetical protein
VSWIVLDASVTLSWCFPDEQTPAAMGVLDLLKAGDQALVPAFWCSEVLNSLLVGERKGRISADETRAFLEDLRALRLAPHARRCFPGAGDARHSGALPPTWLGFLRCALRGACHAVGESPCDAG